MKTQLRIGLLATAAFAATALYAANTARPATMLVLDASGSMWGQIDGKAKIAIARDAVGAMLDGWKGGDLGLMAYGHNRKADCGDIELLQAIGPGTADGIRRQVNALSPKGMTPITESVRRAAEQLRYTEQKATVILVSDGEETCNADPCALGKTLDAAGVDFTAHVVGFDIAKGSKAHQPHSPRPRQFLQPHQPSPGVHPAIGHIPTHLHRRLQLPTHRGPFGLPKNFAAHLFVKLHAGHARWFALGHGGDERGDG